MGFEPTLIIRKKDLDKHIGVFEKEQYSNDELIERVAKYLIQVSEYETIKFDDLELVICKPEFTYFNNEVRNRLHELEIDFRIDN